MKRSVLALVAAFLAAVLMGSGCLFLLLVNLFSELLPTGAMTHVAYSALPCVLLLGSSMAIARWHPQAARLFAWVSTSLYFALAVLIFVVAKNTGIEAFGTTVMGVICLLVTRKGVSLVAHQIKILIGE
ncbi:MAG: hypothetical protein EOP24_46410 [Hyphomicrobiales bacterium]|nr:MAG: hypothetical protein EOP24_46410 [Hyphomicrobiales bacterium]